MKQQQHWKKKEFKDNLDRVLLIIREEKEIIFSELKKRLWVSENTLTGYLKELEKGDLIEHFDKPEDRRKTWYRIKLERSKIVDAQLGFHEAIKFIENFIKDPKNSITVQNEKGEWVEGDWKKKAYTWVDESNPNEPLFFSVIVESKTNPKFFLALNPHLIETTKGVMKKNE